MLAVAKPVRPSLNNSAIKIKIIQLTNNIFSNLFSSVSNSNLDLLVALKPYLSEKRLKKLDQCENFISIIKTFEILNAFNQKTE